MKPKLPHQVTGKETVAHHVVYAADNANAATIFLTARHRLEDVNNWHNIQSKSSFRSRLFNKNGAPTTHRPEVGDFILIDVPGPGPKYGAGWDWVVIESIIETGNPEAQEQFFSFRVRPAANPLSANKDTAHFFDATATNTFSIERIGKQVIASVIGRNERPNTNAKGILAKLRNVAVSAGGAAGFSALSWKWLVKGLLA